MDSSKWNEIEGLLEELIEFQRLKLLKYGRKIIPYLTDEDVLQPNDFPELENHPLFRYEEGTLAGMQTIQMALRAWKNDFKTDSSTNKS